MNTIIDMVTLAFQYNKKALNITTDESFADLVKSNAIFLDGTIFLSNGNDGVDGVIIYLNSTDQEECGGLELSTITFSSCILVRIKGVEMARIKGVKKVRVIGAIELDENVPQEILDTFVSMLYSRAHNPYLTTEEIEFMDIISEVNAL